MTEDGDRLFAYGAFMVRYRRRVMDPPMEPSNCVAEPGAAGGYDFTTEEERASCPHAHVGYSWSGELRRVIDAYDDILAEAVDSGECEPVFQRADTGVVPEEDARGAWMEAISEVPGAEDDESVRIITRKLGWLGEADA